MAKGKYTLESFLRGYRLSPEARQLYLIYTLIGEYSREKGWVNKSKNPYIHVTKEILESQFGFYTKDIKELHKELVGLNLMQSRGSCAIIGDYSLVILKPKELDLPEFIPCMPRAIQRSKKTLMYQWRAFIQKMLASGYGPIKPLTQHIYCDILIPCALAQQTVQEIREENFSDMDFIGALKPHAILTLATHLGIKIPLAQLKKSMLELETLQLVELKKFSESGLPSLHPGLEDMKLVWSSARKFSSRFTYLIGLPKAGDKDYSVFFGEPGTTLALIEEIAKNMPNL